MEPLLINAFLIIQDLEVLKNVPQNVKNQILNIKNIMQKMHIL